MQAILALEDGRVFRGKGYGATKDGLGEVVFNTSITGYQEIFTDPSYAGQIVCLTNPEIGNYGTNPEDEEARKPYIEGLVVREFSRVASNWRSNHDVADYLEKWGIPCIADIDTRALVRHLRDHGVKRGVISLTETDAGKLIERAKAIPQMVGLDLAKVVTTAKPYGWEKGPWNTEVEPPKHHVVAYDFGIKHNILRMLT
ncbi:MAG TPA: carbamoyl-phosphate synthase domain-containing protein, partial [Terriglobales bacterium]|nr:carbamoyl-phosphate synthase domain-containing protein [Terriglobales bacterium]